MRTAFQFVTSGQLDVGNKCISAIVDVTERCGKTRKHNADEEDGQSDEAGLERVSKALSLGRLSERHCHLACYRSVLYNDCRYHIRCVRCMQCGREALDKFMKVCWIEKVGRRYMYASPSSTLV